MAERIYNRGRDGELEPLEEERFSTEDELQELIATHPELLDGEQMRPGDPRRWILITREKGISETADSGARWSLDHLIVDQDAIPTLVEVKRGTNSKIRRTVVGQMLEYAANAARTWTADELRQSFEDTSSAAGSDPDEELARLLQSDGELDVDGYWESVSTNLKAQRLRLLFVADEIPDTLERIVEFLNAHMPEIEVLAVEIKQFRGKLAQTLVPRVIGRAADVSTRSAGRRPPDLTKESFLEKFDEESRSAAARLIDEAQRAGGKVALRSTSLTIQGQSTRWRNPIGVAWLSVPSNDTLSASGNGRFQFGFSTESWTGDSGPDEGLRTILERYANSFSGDSFATEVADKRMVAWEIPSRDAARHIDVLVGRVTGVLAELAELKPL